MKKLEFTVKPLYVTHSVVVPTRIVETASTLETWRVQRLLDIDGVIDGSSDIWGSAASRRD